MEKLKYQVDDKTIAQLLGVQNFINPEAAILELVKNAYDAHSPELSIAFSKDKIVVEDKGVGMSKKDIKGAWMTVGLSEKGYDTKDHERVLAGSKGIGRFAMARLGAEAEVVSKKDGFEGVLWKTNWSENYLFEDNGKESGTKITISKLRDRWSDTAIEDLKHYLDKTYNNSMMKITIFSSDKEFKVSPYFGKAKIGVNYLTEFDLLFDSTTGILKFEMKSDEFSEEAKKYYPAKSLNSYSTEINIPEELSGQTDIDIDNNDINKNLQKLGSFSGTFYFGMFRLTESEKDEFLYKHTLTDRLDDGIVLYRNAFSISSFEGEKDWLQFGKRSRRSPAAASHPSGSWRVRENQISGFVDIDKRTNVEIKDLSNRQGVEEDNYYMLFKKIIQLGIEEFERKRQEIIRAIDRKNVFVPRVSTTISDKIVNNPNTAQNLSKNDAQKLAGEIAGFKQDEKKIVEEKEKSEQRYKYDIRILNVLSTLGLRASSIAHEMENDRTAIYENVDNTISRLQALGVWDLVSSPENTKIAAKNVPGMLQKNKEVNKKIVEFMDTMLTDIEQDQFDVKDIALNKEINAIVDNWKNDYSWAKFHIEIDLSIIIHTTEDALKVIFDNLILNSLQQNELRQSLNISIQAERCAESTFLFKYSDDGVGLPPKFEGNPMKILEPHQTSRKKGHGLGMWIVNNTLIMTGGCVIEIPYKKGFSISFTMGEIL